MWEKISLIYMMRDILFSNYIKNNTHIDNDLISIYLYKEIIPAKQKFVLKIFGGDETFEEYRKNFISINDNNEFIIMLYEDNIEKKIKNNLINYDYKLKR
jgi:hypothetical protein